MRLIHAVSLVRIQVPRPFFVWYNGCMIHKRNGFTLIEVALFLAVSGLLLVGVLAMTQNSISSQRFNDSTQNFAEFLRSVYSQAANPQSIGDGRSEKAIYGRLVTFGESYGLDGKKIPSGVQKIFVYDVVGNANSSGTGDTKKLLEGVGANVVMKSLTDATLSPAGLIEEYTPRWGAVIDGLANGSPYVGMLLVVRHPRSGEVTTLIASGYTIEVNQAVAELTADGAKDLLTGALERFTMQQVDFCINTSGYEAKSDVRSDVRLIKNARNASGIEIIDLDSTGNLCRS